MPTTISDLYSFEAFRPMIEPLIQYLRVGNAALDMAFYDVEATRRDMKQAGLVIEAGDKAGGKDAAAIKDAIVRLDLGALANPEGSILVVDTSAPPHVTRFADVTTFLDWAGTHGEAAANFSITGVGSSALGSAAFAWDISKALGAPVVAIVPGYGVADVLQQALGGWFGFGVHNYLIKELSQQLLATTAPGLATIGRKLLQTAPGHAEAANGAPVFRRGCGSSDVLHAILQALPDVKRLFGHSKGALAIGNAILGLPPATTDRLEVLTFGCTISESAVRTAAYDQTLGWVDALGLLNSWGNKPEKRVLSHHSTNTAIPLSMRVEALVRATVTPSNPAVH